MLTRQDHWSENVTTSQLLYFVNYSDVQFRKENLNLIVETLALNSYPLHLISKESKF